MACSKTFSITVEEGLSDSCLTDPDVTNCISTPGLLPPGVQLTVYHKTFSSSEVPPQPGKSRTYGLYSGTLPPTTTIDPDGSIGGSLTTPGIYDFFIGLYFDTVFPPVTPPVCTKCFRLVVTPEVPIECDPPHNIGELVWTTYNNQVAHGAGTAAFAMSGGSGSFTAAAESSFDNQIEAAAATAWCNSPTGDLSEGYEATFNIHMEWSLHGGGGSFRFSLANNGVVILSFLRQTNVTFQDDVGSQDFAVSALIEPVNNSFTVWMRIIGYGEASDEPSEASGTISITPLIKP